MKATNTYFGKYTDTELAMFIKECSETMYYGMNPAVKQDDSIYWAFQEYKYRFNKNFDEFYMDLLKFVAVRFRKINGKWCSFDPECQTKPRTYVNGGLCGYGLVCRSNPPAHKGVDLRKHAYLA